MKYKRKHPSKISKERAQELFDSRNKIGTRETALKYGISEASLYTYLWSWGYTKSLKLTNDEFVARLKEVNPLITPLTEYKSQKDNVLVKDNLGVIYSVVASGLLYGKKPRITSAINKKDAFIIRAKLKHGDKYDYSILQYVNNSLKIDIICPKHGVFRQLAQEHLNGCGCPRCAGHNVHSKTGWMKMAGNRICTVYLIEMSNGNEKFIKVGITSLNKIKDRFYPKASPYKYNIIFEGKGDSGFIFDSEKKILKLFRAYKYSPILKFGGDHECFQYPIKETILSYMEMIIPNAR